MSLKSMTGFARSSGEMAPFRWNIELKSVNNKGLEIRTKLPGFLDGFDIELKKVIGKGVTRGSLFLNLHISRLGDDEQFVVNQARLANLVEVAGKLAGIDGLEAARVDGLLAVKGVVELVSEEPTDDELKNLKIQLKEDLTALLNDLVESRSAEGNRMQGVLEDQLLEMKRLLDEARTAVGDRDVAMRNRFEAQLAKLTKLEKPVPDDRLAQEIALLAVKSDIQEEFDRLESHFEEAEKLLSSGKPVGRRLDFLCQEFNREANTLCSKSGDTAVTRIGVDLKVLIDQFREQVQNIE